MFNIIEKFLSINGEGPASGELSTFIRFKGCNLRCRWCDTKYSYDEKEITETLSSEEIYKYIKSTGVNNVTLTGGEPLIQEGIENLLKLLSMDESLNISIETNGSVDISRFKKDIKSNNIRYILDFKLPGSEMTKFMNLNNISFVDNNDVYKFVIAGMNDLKYAMKIIKTYDLTSKCMVFFSPVMGEIQLKSIVEFMKENKLNSVKLQIQMHKIIWDSEARGV